MRYVPQHVIRSPSHRKHNPFRSVHQDVRIESMGLDELDRLCVQYRTTPDRTGQAIQRWLCSDERHPSPWRGRMQETWPTPPGTGHRHRWMKERSGGITCTVLYCTAVR
jgi:hypothetical protein